MDLVLSGKQKIVSVSCLRAKCVETDAFLGVDHRQFSSHGQDSSLRGRVCEIVESAFISRNVQASVIHAI